MNRFWKKKLPAFLLALVMMMSLVPAASAATTSIDYELEVEAGEEVKISRKTLKDLCEEEADEDFYYLVFTSYDDLDDYGYLSAKV